MYAFDQDSRTVVSVTCGWVLLLGPDINEGDETYRSTRWRVDSFWML